MNFKNLLMILMAISLMTFAGCSAPVKTGEDVSVSNADKATTAKIGVQLADYIMATYPTYMDYETSVVKKGWEYTNGVVLYGFIKLYESTGKIKYLDYVKPYADQYILADGTIQYLMGDGVSTRDKRILDVIQPSTILFDLYKNYSSSQYLTAMKNTRNIFPQIQTYSASYSDANIIQTNTLGGFFHKPTYQFQMWLDGLYMGAPFIVRYGDRYADKFDSTGVDKQRCYDIGAYQLKLVAQKTMDLTQTTDAGKLPVHGWLDWAGFNAYNAANTTQLTAPAWADTTTGKSPEKWSRALGWYTMALVDTLEFLPRDHADYQTLKTTLKTIAAGLKATQDPTTGLWFQVVDKTPANGYTDNWVETSGSAMFIYALKKAATKGYIGTEYAAVASKGWTGLKSKVVIADGVVTVKGTVGGMSILNNYAAYISKSSIVADNVPHGIAAVLFAASVMEY
jgi:unsaturated rhamnogalacturonyl hydrolase